MLRRTWHRGGKGNARYSNLSMIHNCCTQSSEKEWGVLNLSDPFDLHTGRVGCPRAPKTVNRPWSTSGDSSEAPPHKNVSSVIGWSPARSDRQKRSIPIHTRRFILRCNETGTARKTSTQAYRLLRKNLPITLGSPLSGWYSLTRRRLQKNSPSSCWQRFLIWD